MVVEIVCDNCSLSCVALSARNKATNPFGMIITLSRIAKGGQKHAMIFPGIYFQPCMQYTVAFPWNKCAHCVIKKCYSWFSFTSVLSIFHTHLDSMRVQMLNILDVQHTYYASKWQSVFTISIVLRMTRSYSNLNVLRP